MIENLPRNLAALDQEQIGAARQARDERMSVLFGDWPSLSRLEMRELRKLSDERQRLARHLGTLRALRTLAAHPPLRRGDEEWQVHDVGTDENDKAVVTLAPVIRRVTDLGASGAGIARQSHA